MKSRFSILSLVMSLVFSAIGFLSGVLVENLLLAIFNYSLDNLMLILLSGYLFAATLVFGCFGLRFGLWLKRKKYQPAKLSVKHLLVAAGLAFAVGAVGQLVYSLEYQTRTRTVQVDNQLKGAHVVLLMDESSSMDGMKDACDEAACAFVDSLDENISLQFAAFAFDVQDYNVSDFLVMTPENKENMKTLIRSAADSGGTDFDEALSLAVDTLNRYADPYYKPVIIMLTDGVDEIENRTVLQTLKDPDSNIAFFSVRLTDSDATDRQDGRVKALIDLADEDFPIAPAADGSVDIQTVKAAFQNALASASTNVETYQVLAFGNEFILHENAIYGWRIAARVLVCAVFSVLTAMAYYGPLDKKSVALHAVLGAACGTVMACTLTGAGLLALWLLCVGAFTTLEEVQQHV